MKAQAEEDRFAGVPAWKRKMLAEREQKKREEDAVMNAAQQKLDAEKARIEGLPEWKKALIQKKR